MKITNTTPLTFLSLITGLTLGLATPEIYAQESTSDSNDKQAGPLRIGVAGVAAIQNPRVERSGSLSSVTGATNYGAGLVSELVFNPNVGLEIDLLYLNHTFSQLSSEFFGQSLSSTISSGAINIPILLRYRPIPFLNLGLGGYYSRVVTNWTVSAAGYNDTTTDFGKNDLGVTAAIGGLLPLGNSLSVMGDFRVAQSLKEIKRSTGEAVQFTDFQFVVGLIFGI